MKSLMMSTSGRGTRIKLALAAMLVVPTLFGGVAHAALIASTYSSSASFFAAADDGLITEDFEGVGFAANGQAFDPAHPGLASGVNYSGNNLSYFDGTYGFPQIQTVQLFSNSFSSFIQLDFATNVSALGFNIVSWAVGSVMTVDLLDDLGVVHTFNPDASTTNPAYFGILASSGFIQRATLYSGAVTVGLDNLSFGQARAVPVPEPSTLALLGLSLAGLAASRRRKMFEC